MNYWHAYTRRVNSNCSSPDDKRKDLSYWRDSVFAGTVAYLLPFCLIALLPGVYFALTSGKPVLALIDILTLVGMVVVALIGGLKLLFRKILFITLLYALSCTLVYDLGLYGPGLVYLLAVCIISTLIFPTVYKFWPAWLNTAICLSFAGLISYDIMPWPNKHEHPVAEWIVVSSNLVFLSFLCAALIPRLFNGLQDTLDKEQELKHKLDIQQQSLIHALDQLQEKNNELEQFAYVASHDLKEPLRMVTNFMGLLKNKYGSQLDGKAHTYIDFAVDGGKRMQKMIADLLELSRSARQVGDREPVDFNALIDEVKQNVFKLVEDNQAEIIIKSELPVLDVYRADMIRLMQNLLSNAIKFRKQETNPVIFITATKEKSVWQFRIEDNGIGIDTEQHKKVFDIFTRLHAQATYEGTGIGLAICKKIVERNGGEIWVESEGGAGSAFIFTIKHN